MEVIDVKVVGAQPLEALVDGAQDGLAREALLVRLVAHLAMDLAGDDEPVALAFNGVAEHGFGDPLLVYIRGVEEVDPGIDAAVDELRGAGLIERFAEGHGAEAEAGNFQVGVLERDRGNLHLFLPVRSSYQ